MARFAPIKTSNKRQVTSDKILGSGYKYGFAKPTDKYAYKAPKGLSQRTVEEISSQKGESAWMRRLRLKALRVFESKPVPTWGGDLGGIDWQDIHYYLRPIDAVKRSWADVPAEIKETFDRIGILEAEQKYLAGVSSQYDSQTVYDSLRQTWEKKGVVFLGMDEGLKRYPELVKQYFGTVVPMADNKLAALNWACWSGGSFIYVPKGVKVDMPLQAYFRINAERVGQFERTLIIADEESEMSYVEGCFTAGTVITTNLDYKLIEEVKVGDQVLTHIGRYKRVYHVQERKYSGVLYRIKVYGDSTASLEVTAEHPFLYVKRQLSNERNYSWKNLWGAPGDLEIHDYLAVPVNKVIKLRNNAVYKIRRRDKMTNKMTQVGFSVPSNKEFFRLVGYYLAEGNVDMRGYLRFTFGSHERDYIEDVKKLLRELFPNISKIHELQDKRHSGVSIIVGKVELARTFANFGVHSDVKYIPQWMMLEDPQKQKELVIGLFRGDGNYYFKQHKSGRKEVFRISTVSKKLARQIRDILLRLGIVAFLNRRSRVHEGGRKDMYTVGIGGEFMGPFGKLVGIPIEERLYDKKRGTYFGIDDSYAYLPIRSIVKRRVCNETVYNFGVKEDETYTALGVAVHNCSSPSYSSASLHAAVVEIIVKQGARVQYTTVQNWWHDVYNLVTKRAWVEAEGVMEWIDFNMGSKLTMKYPSVVLAGKGARGETVSMALAGKGQHQDVGSKAIHLAPYTASTITSKSISKDGGRTSYRGMVMIGPKAHGAKSKVVCDALLLDPQSRSDTYPTNRILCNDVSLEHEATVSKIGEEQLFYLMSRGLTEAEASQMIVNGFVEPLVKKLPLEYAVEMNRLIDMEMEGSVG